VSARALDALRKAALCKREATEDLLGGFRKEGGALLGDFLEVPPCSSRLPELARFGSVGGTQEEACQSDESRWYVTIFAEPLLRFALSGMVEWTASTGVREQIIRMCTAVMLMADTRKAMPFTEELIIHIYRAIRDDDVDAEARVTKACRTLFGVIVDRVGVEAFGVIVNIMAKHLGCTVGDTPDASASDGDYWNEENLGRVTTRVVGAVRTTNNYRVTSQAGAQ
ncbi:HEAT repeat-containing protein 2, partial [Perkinsus olseni]